MEKSKFVFLEERNMKANHALQRTRHVAVVCRRGVPRAGSLSLGR